MWGCTGDWRDSAPAPDPGAGRLYPGTRPQFLTPPQQCSPVEAEEEEPGEQAGGEDCHHLPRAETVSREHIYLHTHTRTRTPHGRLSFAWPCGAGLCRRWLGRSILRAGPELLGRRGRRVRACVGGASGLASSGTRFPEGGSVTQCVGFKEFSPPPSTLVSGSSRALVLFIRLARPRLGSSHEAPSSRWFLGASRLLSQAGRVERCCPGTLAPIITLPQVSLRGRRGLGV